MKSEGIRGGANLSPKPIFFALTLVVALAGGAGRSKADKDDKSASAAATTNAEEKAGVTVDAATQARIGLQTAAPVTALWQPQIHAVGFVVDPLMFLTAVTDLATARSAAEASARELDRTKKLAKQDNASARTLETAEAAATHDLMAKKSAEATFYGNWGMNLAGRTDLVDMAQQLVTNGTALVKLSLPAGTILSPAPSSAMVSLLNSETNQMAVPLVDDLGIDPASQTQTLLFSSDRNLPRGAAVIGTMAITGDPEKGVLVPFSAVLRLQGLGWVYVASGTNQFVRVEIPLDRQEVNGWFVSKNLSVTNQVVVTGAQTVLSAELGVNAGGDGD